MKSVDEKRPAGSMGRASLRVLTAVVVAIAVVWGSVLTYNHQRWRNFAEVAPGQIYRSGLLRSEQLSEAIDRYSIKTVVCLTAKEAERERSICQDRGVELISYDMHSSGFGKPEDFRQIVRILSDRSRQPVLVHCTAGVARTGAAVALYRMSVDGWSFERAIAELKTFERRGRCEAPLQAMIADYYQRDFVPQFARR